MSESARTEYDALLLAAIQAIHKTILRIDQTQRSTMIRQVPDPDLDELIAAIDKLETYIPTTPTKSKHVH